MKADDLLKLSQTTLEEILDSETRSMTPNLSSPILTAPPLSIEKAIKRKGSMIMDINNVYYDDDNNSNSINNNNNDNSNNNCNGSTKNKKRKISLSLHINGKRNGEGEGKGEGEGEVDDYDDRMEDDEEDSMSDDDESSKEEIRGSAQIARGSGGSKSFEQIKPKLPDESINHELRHDMSSLISCEGSGKNKNKSITDNDKNSDSNSNNKNSNNSNSNSNNNNNNNNTHTKDVPILDTGTNASDRPYGGQGEHGEESQLEYLEESFQLIALMVRGNAARIKDDMK